MSISTIGIVDVDCKDVFLIRRKLIKALREFRHPDALSNPLTFSLEGNFLTATFKTEKDVRTLFIFLKQYDWEEFPEHVIHFSLGCNEEAKSIIKACLKEFSDMGRTYFLAQDCDGDFKELTFNV